MAVSLVPGALSRAISGSSTKSGVQRQGEAAVMSSQLVYCMIWAAVLTAV